MDTAVFGRRSSIARLGAAILFAGLLAVGTGERVTRAASLPAHGGSFSCALDGAGNRTVHTNVQYAYSSLSKEQVWWYAIVYRKTSTGYQFVSYVTNETQTGYAGPTGMQINYSIGATWWGSASGLAYRGGSTVVPSAGTYLVGEYFWWAKTAPSWHGVWATNLFTGQTSCTFTR